VTRSDGSSDCTDPDGRLTQEEGELDFSGVHRIASDGTLTNATAETEYPNGLAFSPDERVLYVAIIRRDDGVVRGKRTARSARTRSCGPSMWPRTVP
jgi:sugar lactone lactonase YvrE